jgi:TRAP-type C4-dicarboxylate transport system permease small subunit
MVRLRNGLERVLEAWLIFLITALTAIVVIAVIFRRAGASFAWYDEVASIMLAWITYYGAALAALKRAHIGFDGFLLALPPKMRLAAMIVAELIVIAFFVVLAFAGWRLLQVLFGMGLISLPWVPVRLTQSVIPVAAVLFIVCELLSLPEYWKRVREGVSSDDVEISHALEQSKEAGKP